MPARTRNRFTLNRSNPFLPTSSSVPSRSRHPRAQNPSVRDHRASTPTAPPTQTAPEGENDPWSPSLEAVLEQPPSQLPLFLTLGGLLFISAFGAWSWLGQFDEIGHAQGRLVPQGELYKIHSSEAGKIVSLAVKEGDTVKEGDLIAVLDNDLAKVELERLRQASQSLELQLLQQKDLMGKLQLELQSRQFINDADVQAQRVAIAQAALKVETSLGLFQQSQVDLDSYRERINRIEPLVAEGAIARERLFDIEQQMRDRQSNVIQNQGGVAQAQTEVQQLKALLDQRMAEGQRSVFEGQQQLQSLILQITQLQGKLQENETLLRSAQTRFQQYFLHAPVSGIVSSLAIKNPGEVIQPGQTLLEMRSSDDPLVLEAALNSREAGFVKVGMPVKIKFDAYPYQKFGVISGKVVFTSPDSEIDPQLGAIYRIKVQLERNYILSEEQKVEFKAGQTAIADIVIRRRRIIDILLEPIQQLRQNSGAS